MKYIFAPILFGISVWLPYSYTQPDLEQLRLQRKKSTISVITWTHKQLQQECIKIKNELAHASAISALPLQEYVSTLLHTQSVPQQSKLLQEHLDLFDVAHQSNSSCDKAQYLCLAIHCMKATTTVMYQLHNQMSALQVAQKYWLTQQRSGWWYFLHKSPTKWFMGPRQKQELAKKISAINALYAEYATELGLLMRQMHVFDSSATTHDIAEWVVHTSSEIIRISEGFFNNAQVTLSVKQIALLMNYTLEQVVKLPILYAKKMDPVQIPGHFERHWLKYAFLTALGTYVTCNSVAVSTSFNELLSGSLFALNTHVINPIKRVFRLAFGTPEQEEKLKELNIAGQNESILSNKGLRQASKNIEQQRKEIIKVLEKDYHDVSAGDPHLLKHQAEKERITYVETAKELARTTKETMTDEEINKRIQLMDATGNFYHVMHDSFKNKVDIDGLWSLFWSDKPLMIKVGLAEKAAKAHFYLMWLYNQKRSGEKLGLETTVKFLDNIALPLNDAHASINNLDKHLQWLVSILKDMEEKMGLSLEILTLMPATLASYITFCGLQKTYQWWHNIDYSAMNYALCDAQKILIKDPEHLNNMLYGSLVHLVFILRQYAQSSVSDVDGTRQEFLKDLADLESDDLTGKQKNELITVMRQRYKFL